MPEKQAYQLYIDRNPRCRMVRLRFEPDRMQLRVTVPERMTEREVAEIISRHRRWIENRAARAAEKQELSLRYRPVAGGVVPFLGRDYPVVSVNVAADYVGFGVTARMREDRIEVSSSDPETVKRELELFYLTRAEKILPERLSGMASENGVDFKSFKISDARGRWGSCSGNGRIRLSWRLVFFPMEIIDGVAAHELAHRRWMNHSADFYREWGRIYPDYLKVREFLTRAGDSYGFL